MRTGAAFFGFAVSAAVGFAVGYSAGRDANPPARAKEPAVSKPSVHSPKLEKVPIGESPARCAQREIEEEAGIHVPIERLHLMGLISEQALPSRWCRPSTWPNSCAATHTLSGRGSPVRSPASSTSTRPSDGLPIDDV